jgi:hypothetical protein
MKIVFSLLNIIDDGFRLQHIFQSKSFLELKLALIYRI